MGADTAAQLVPLRTKDEVRASIETVVEWFLSVLLH